MWDLFNLSHCGLYVICNNSSESFTIAPKRVKERFQCDEERMGLFGFNLIKDEVVQLLSKHLSTFWHPVAGTHCWADLRFCCWFARKMQQSPMAENISLSDWNYYYCSTHKKHQTSAKIEKFSSTSTSQKIPSIFRRGFEKRYFYYVCAWNLNKNPHPRIILITPRFMKNIITSLQSMSTTNDQERISHSSLACCVLWLNLNRFIIEEICFLTVLQAKHIRLEAQRATQWETRWKNIYISEARII